MNYKYERVQPIEIRKRSPSITRTLERENIVRPNSVTESSDENMDTESVSEGDEINAKNKNKKLQGSNMQAVQIQELRDDFEQIEYINVIDKKINEPIKGYLNLKQCGKDKENSKSGKI